MTQSDTVLSLATKIASSYFGNNKLGQEEIPDLISSVREALSKLESGELVREPAVPIDKSVKQSEIICLECGNGHKMLKRHLTSVHGVTSEEYRKQWGLTGDYPLVAPSYAMRRSELAKQMGLGRKPGSVSTGKSNKAAAKSTKSKARRKR